MASLADARTMAVRTAGDLLRDAGDKFWAMPDLTVTVADKTDLTLWTISVTGQETAGVSATQPKRR